MTLKDTLRDDLTTAMKAGDARTVATLRMALTAISRQEVSGKSARELSDAEITAVLTGESKRRREAAEAFTAGGRPELAANELAEAEVLARYLPEPLSEEELARLIADAVAQAQEQGMSGGRAMGAVMKSLKTETTGRVEGSALAARVKAALGIG